MSTDGSERELLIEQVCSAWRPRTADGSIHAHPAWSDLSDEARREAFEDCVLLRRLEAALHPTGLSSTGRVVMERIARGRADNS